MGDAPRDEQKPGAAYASPREALEDRARQEQATQAERVDAARPDPLNVGTGTSTDMALTHAGAVDPATMGELSDFLLKSTLGAVAGGVAPYAANGASKVGRWMMDQLNLPGMSAPERSALEKIARALADDQMTAAEARKALADAAPKSLSMIDVAGKNMLGLGRDTVLSPGPARDLAAKVLRDRQFGNDAERIPSQIDRVLGDVGSLISPNTDFYGTAAKLVDERKAQAAPLYEAAEKNGAVFSPRIRKIFETPTGKQALKRAFEMAGDEGVDLEGLYKGLNDNKFTNRQDTMKLLHYFKMGVDDVMESHMGEDMFGDPKQTTRSRHIYNNLKRPLISELDRQNDDYRKARQVYSSHSESLDALAKGRKFIGEDADVTAKDIAAMSAGDREFFRIGAVRAVRDLINKTPDGADVVKRIFGSPQKRKVLEQVFPDPALYNEFVERMGHESTMFNTAREVLGGSQTADKLAAASKNAIDDPFLAKLFNPDTKALLLAGANAASGRMGTALIHGSALVNNRLGKGMTAPVREQLGNRLFDPTQATSTLRSIEQVGRKAAQRSKLLRRLGGVGALLGMSAGAGAAVYGTSDEQDTGE